MIVGGRGASSGKYFRNGKWHVYGDEYHTIYQYQNVKFVKTLSGSATAPMETRTPGRVYATVNASDELKSIAYYGNGGKREKQIDLDHQHRVNGVKTMPHTHLGYVHDEGGTREPSEAERRMIDKVSKLWYSYTKKGK